jgi:hypothetical protein
MLIKFKDEEKKTKPRIYLKSYTTPEIVELFAGKYNCKECPFMLVWTGKVNEGVKDIHRMYCKFAHVGLHNLPVIFGLPIEETYKLVERLYHKDDLAPDIVKIHPKTKRQRFILSCILVKELGDSCIIDNHREGKKLLDKTLYEKVIEWRKKFLK